MFAPDTFPKPFYLMYIQSVETPSATNLPSGTVTASPTKKTPTPTTKGGHAMASGEILPGQGLMVDTGTKIVNLVDPTGRKYLRAGVVLEFAPTDPKYSSFTPEEMTAYKTLFFEEMSSKLPVINDVIITLLSSQTYDTVYTAQAKEVLRKKIIENINKQLPENLVLSVYFTEFVVQ
jgi:flagellar basal body-associated protein FliL